MMACILRENITKYALRSISLSNSKCVQMNHNRSMLGYKDIPRAPYIPIFGSDPFLWLNGGVPRLHYYVEKMHKRLGPVFVNKTSAGEMLYVADPISGFEIYRYESVHPEISLPGALLIFQEETQIKRGLIFMKGQEWHDNRRILNKLLMVPNAMEPYVQDVAAVTRDFLDAWKVTPPRDILEQHLYSWNFECFGDIFFGSRLGFIEKLAHHDKNDKEYMVVNSSYESFLNTADLTGKHGLISKIIHRKKWQEFNSNTKNSIDGCKFYVRKGIEGCNKRPDDKTKKSMLFKLMQEIPDRDQVSNLVTDLMIASADTTALAVRWAFYFLGRNPKVAARARREIHNVTKDGPLTMEAIDKLSYIKGITKETLRLVSLFLARALETDMVLYGYFIPKGTNVLTSLYVMARDQDNFTDPYLFNPDRWSREGSENKLDGRMNWVNHNQFAYRPWSHGRRGCVGRRVAELSMTVLLVEALRTFEWTADEVDIYLRLGAAPTKNIFLKLKEL